MKITENNVKEETLTAEQEDDLFFTLARGKIMTEEIETSKGVFTVKFPNQRDLISVGRKAVLLRSGISANALDYSTEQLIEKIAYLDMLVIDGPAWYTNIKDKNKSFGWEDMPDANFIDEVFAKAYIFRNKVQEMFRPKDENRDNKKTKHESIDDPLQADLFEGISLG